MSIGTESLSRSFILTSVKDFEYLRLEPSRIKVGGLVLFVKPSRLNLLHCRIAFAMNKKTGSSVLRHRLKRIFKEIFRKDLKMRNSPCDILLVVSRFSNEKDFYRDLIKLIKHFSEGSKC